MAKNRVNVDVKVSDKGSLKQVQNRSRQADRTLKGLAKTSSSGTKNFSKMSQGITGGLVPAYATLAANLFAITALFAALKEAADLRVMREGMTEYANTTGVAMMSIARTLEQVTHAQLDYGNAMKSTAQLTAAGFDKTMIIEMGIAARQASAAIGHGFEDAFNRITKGIQKAEPELLDELGIILRLDEATRKYAIQTGKTQKELSLYERTVAVHNEVIGQATLKYGQLNNEIRVSGITQLGVAFENVKKSALEGIAPAAELFAGAFQKNIKLVIAAMILFAITMLKAAGMGDKLTGATDKWQARAVSGATAAKLKQEEFNDALRRSKMTMDEIKGMAAGQLMGIRGEKGFFKGTGDFKGKQRLMKGQLGMLPNKLLREWQKTAPGIEGVTKNMSAKVHKAWVKAIDDMLLKEGEFKTVSKTVFSQVTMDAEAKIMGLAATGASAMGMLATAVKGVGTAFGMIFSWAMKLTMLKMFWEMGAEFAANWDKTYLSIARYLQKFDKFKQFGTEMEEQSKGWRQTKEDIRDSKAELEKMTDIVDGLQKQKDEVNLIANNWDRAASAMEKYIKFANLLKSIDFKKAAEGAISAFREVTRTDRGRLTRAQRKVEEAGAGGYSAGGLVAAADAGDLGGSREFKKSAITGELIQSSAIDDARKALDELSAAQRNFNLNKVEGTRAAENFVLEMEDTAEVLRQLDPGATNLRNLHEYFIELTEVAGMSVPAALKKVSEEFDNTYQPVKDLGGELESVNQLLEKYMKTNNALLQGTLPQGWGKQVELFGQLEKTWNAIQKTTSKDLAIDENMFSMLSGLGIVDNKDFADFMGEFGYAPMMSQIFEEGAEGMSPFVAKWLELQEIAYGYKETLATMNREIVANQNIGMKFQGALGKQANFLYNQEKLRLQIEEKKNNAAAALFMEFKATRQNVADEEIRALPDYKLRLQAIKDQTAALVKQKEILEEMNTWQFKLVDIMQKSFVNMFEQAILGEERFHETFKKIARAMFAQMAQLMAQQAAMNALMGLFPGATNLQKALGGGSREGGIRTQRGSSSYKSFQGGGVASGSQSGYLARLHGTEAVVPLGNDRSIPVEMKGNTQSNTVVVNVSGVGQGQQGGQTVSGDGLQQIGALIGNTVQGVLVDELRPGGLLYTGRGR